MVDPAREERLRFHLDEAVDPDVARALAKHGIDVTTTVEAGLRGEPDDAQLAYAHRTGRVIVTHDADFLRIATARSSIPVSPTVLRQRALSARSSSGSSWSTRCCEPAIFAAGSNFSECS